jgi:hypothetical protein
LEDRIGDRRSRMVKEMVVYTSGNLLKEVVHCDGLAKSCVGMHAMRLRDRPKGPSDLKNLVVQQCGTHLTRYSAWRKVASSSSSPVFVQRMPSCSTC